MYILQCITFVLQSEYRPGCHTCNFHKPILFFYFKYIGIRKKGIKIHTLGYLKNIRQKSSYTCCEYVGLQVYHQCTVGIA